MEDIYNQIANLGFPIVVTLYLLIRIEGKLDKLSTCINTLSISIEKLDSKWTKNNPLHIYKYERDPFQKSKIT